VDSLCLTGPGSEEPSILERAQRGEVQALAELYDRHHPTLCAFARRILGNDAAAEDLVHDVFIMLPKLLERVEPRGSLRSYLMGVAANRAKHHFRARTRYEKMTDRFAREPIAAVESPEQHACRRALALRLGKVLEALSLDQRVTFVICEVHGHSSSEAAEILGVPEATIRTRLCSARKKLRKELEREDRR
jgi:RNA polymerase sigma-70 factor (ECF subfamily)